MNDFQFYFSLGWSHIIAAEAADHLLFLAALAAVFTLRQWKQALMLSTAFTIGHTVAIVARTNEWFFVGDALVEFLVACTIMVTAIANLFQRSFTPRSVRLHYFLALGFGFIHGLAFAAVLQMILAREQSFGLAVGSFAAGLEAGQLLVVLLVLLLCALATGPLKLARRHWVLLVSAVVFALSLKMAIERWPWREKSERTTAEHPASRQKNQPVFLPNTPAITGNSNSYVFAYRHH